MKRYNAAQMQPKAWSILSRSFRAGRVASTYLFHGDEGMGQWPLAISFAALLNCREPVIDDDSGLPSPCGRCHPCSSIEALNFEGLYCALPIRTHKNNDEMIDFTNEILEIKRQEPFAVLSSARPSSIPISIARSVKQSLSRKGGGGITRVALFYQMDKMKTSSADALLKLIEEPPNDTVIILTANRPDRLLPTIQSRSQRIRLNRIAEEAAVPYLTSRYDVSEERARLVTRIVQGNLGRAISMIEDQDDGESSNRAVGFLLFKSLFRETNPTMAGLLIDMINANDRSATEGLLAFWQSLIRDCAYYAATGDEKSLVNIDFSSEVQNLSRFFEDTRLGAHMVDCIKNALADFYLNVHIQTALVALVLKLKSRIPAAR